MQRFNLQWKSNVHSPVVTQLDCSTTTRWKLNEAATDKRCPNSLSYASRSLFFWLMIKLARHIFHRTEYRQSDKLNYGGEYWTKMGLNKFISNRVMHYIVPCGDIPSKTTNFSVDRYTIPDTSCYCIGHAPTSYRMLLYRAWCCQIVINVRR